MSYQFVRIERNGPIAEVVLDRPDRLNALSRELMAELERASRSFLDDADTRVVVFRGEGRHFSAGADLKQPPHVPDTLIERRRAAGLGGRMLRAITEIQQVTIAAIHGAALGGGACIATACDFRIASTDAVCGYPEVNLGINLMWGGLPLCVRLVGPARAKRLVMLGEKVPAATLAEWGFVDEVVEREALLDVARALAARYAGQPPVAVQMIKQSVNQVSGALDGAVMHMDVDQNILTTMTEDREEGVRAFLDKRDPIFRGR